MGLAALRLVSLAGMGFLRSLSSRGTFHGVSWKTARTMQTKIRRMTRPRRILMDVLDFLGEVDMFFHRRKFRIGTVGQEAGYWLVGRSPFGEQVRPVLEVGPYKNMNSTTLGGELARGVRH